jgi:mannose-6-phosphate isomerase-like protein (cupin superfamily)
MKLSGSLGGSREILINGKWAPVKAGDFHVNPRGNVHNTRNPNEDLRFMGTSKNSLSGSKTC